MPVPTKPAADAPTADRRHAQTHPEPYVVAVDLGGTKIVASAVDRRGRSVAEARCATPNRSGSEAVVAAATDLVHAVQDSLPQAAAVGAIGIGSAGVVHPATGVILDSTESISGWKGTRLTALIEDRTGLPTRAVNDVHAHALGTWFLMAPNADATVLVVAVGTGVGGAVVAGGTLQRGARGAAGHIGHMASVHAGNTRCTCGGAGHLESVASGPGILETYRRAGGDAADTEAVAVKALAGDHRARSSIDLAAAAAGSVVGSLINAVDPDLVAVTGGVPGIGPVWWDRFESAARAEALPILQDVPIVSSPGASTALVGASRLWFDAETRIEDGVARERV